MKVIRRALPAALALVLLLIVWNQSARSASPDTAASTIYMPLARCPSCPAAATPTRTAVPVNPGADAAEVIRLVNIERAAVGCPAIVADARLIAATQAWAEYMRDHSYFGHASASWYAPYGYPSGVLENIGGGGTPALTVEQWLASPSHKANLLWCYPPSDPSYNPAYIYVAGVGHAGPYWVWGLTLTLP